MTLKELEKIKKEKDEEVRRIELSVLLGICPVCDAILMTDKRKELKPLIIFGFTIRRYQKYDWRVFCPNDTSHYEFNWNNSGF